MADEIPHAQREIIAALVTQLYPQLVGVEIRLVIIALAHLLATGLAEMGSEDAEKVLDLLTPMIKRRMLNILEDREQASAKPPGVTLQ